MSSTFDQVATIIAETCDIPRDTITPESHAIDDLGIDSLDFLDIAFAIDKAFGIKMLYWVMPKTAELATAVVAYVGGPQMHNEILKITPAPFISTAIFGFACLVLASWLFQRKEF